MFFNGQGLAETFSRPRFPIKYSFSSYLNLKTTKQPQILFMFKVKYVDSIMMIVRLDLNLIVSLFQHKCEVSETVSTTTLVEMYLYCSYSFQRVIYISRFICECNVFTDINTCYHINPCLSIVTIYHQLPFSYIKL